MKFGPEDKFGMAAGLFDGPAGEAAGHLDDVLLRIAGVDTDGVKLHHFAAVVFVEAAILIFLFRGRGGISGEREISSEPTLKASAARGDFPLMALKCRGIDALAIIEEKEHRWTLGRCKEQISKLAQSIGTDGIPHVRCEQPAIRALVGEDIKVIEPEIFHHRLELTIAINRAVELAHGEFGDDSAGALHFR